MNSELWILLLGIYLLGFLLVGMFLVGCSRQEYMTDEEIEADIASYRNHETK